MAHVEWIKFMDPPIDGTSELRHPPSIQAIMMKVGSKRPKTDRVLNEDGQRQEISIKLTHIVDIGAHPQTDGDHEEGQDENGCSNNEIINL